MSGKKIAITLFKYFPYGGLQKDFLGIAEELYKRNYTLKVFTRSWSGEIPAWLDVMEIGENGLTNASKDRKFVDEVFEGINEFNPEIVFGFNKMPGLDLYFAADTCFAKHSINKHFLQRKNNSVQEVGELLCPGRPGVTEVHITGLGGKPS